MYNYTWLVELTIKDGQKNEFLSLAQEMVTDIKVSEPNTLTYEFYLSEDGTSSHIYERYQDADAFKHHMANFEAKFGDRFGACVEIARFTVYGKPDDEITTMLEDFGAEFMPMLAG